MTSLPIEKILEHIQVVIVWIASLTIAVIVLFEWFGGKFKGKDKVEDDEEDFLEALIKKLYQGN